MSALLSSESLRVRYATVDDVAWCSLHDADITEHDVVVKSNEMRIFVAELGGNNAGYARIEFLWPALPFIAMMHVEQVHRRKGVGTALLSFVECELGIRGCSKILTSAQANEPLALTWWQQSGFARCGTLRGLNVDGVDEVFLLKSIPNAMTY